MHLLLTDRLACPRCGPEFGLILLANRMVDRRVEDGVLGCPNCRDSFSVTEGFGDLRAPPRREPAPGRAGAPQDIDEEALMRLMALLGIERGPGTIGLVGEPARCGAEMAARIPDVHVVGVDPDLARWPDAERFSRMMSAPGIPFFARSLRGVAVDGRLGPHHLDEAVRVLAPQSRVVVVHAPAECSDRLVERGLAVLAAEAGTVVAARA